MPRIYDSGNDPLDFCKGCFPDEEDAKKMYGDTRITGEGPDGRGNCFGYDAEHPAYEHENYHCCACGTCLKQRDN